VSSISRFSLLCITFDDETGSTASPLCDSPASPAAFELAIQQAEKAPFE